MMNETLAGKSCQGLLEHHCCGYFLLCLSITVKRKRVETLRHIVKPHKAAESDTVKYNMSNNAHSGFFVQFMHRNNLKVITMGDKKPSFLLTVRCMLWCRNRQHHIFSLPGQQSIP